MRYTNRPALLLSLVAATCLTDVGCSKKDSTEPPVEEEAPDEGNGGMGGRANAMDPASDTECEEDQTRPRRSGETCGLNGRGTYYQTCTEGEWDEVLCEDPDECTDDETQFGSCEGDEGRLEQSCVEGAWADVACY